MRFRTECCKCGTQFFLKKIIRYLVNENKKNKMVGT